MNNKILRFIKSKPEMIIDVRSVSFQKAKSDGIITRTKFNIPVVFVYGENKTTSFGLYSDDLKVAYINLYSIFKWGDKKPMTELLNEIETTIIHEVTHWIDYQTWKSWQYKNNLVEHLATFMELHHSTLEDVKKQAMKYARDNGLLKKKFHRDIRRSKENY